VECDIGLKLGIISEVIIILRDTGLLCDLSYKSGHEILALIQFHVKLGSYLAV
jgi:hypothetical protein